MKISYLHTFSLSTLTATLLGALMLAPAAFASDPEDMAKLGNEGSLVCDDCNLSGENLTAYTNFFKARLRKADLSSTTMNGMNMRGIDLTDADLTYANLKNVIFTQATLTNVDFSHADLTGATFGGADLTGTEVDGADFTDANLTNATVEESAFNYATLCRTTIPDGRVTNRDCED